MTARNRSVFPARAVATGLSGANQQGYRLFGTTSLNCGNVKWKGPCQWSLTLAERMGIHPLLCVGPRLPGARLWFSTRSEGQLPAFAEPAPLPGDNWFSVSPGWLHAVNNRSCVAARERPCISVNRKENSP